MNTEITNLTEWTLEKLLNTIEYHNHRYWNLGEPEISDDAYDALLLELRNRDPQHPLLKKIHAQHVSANSGKIKLATPMLSLDKAYSLDEVLDWAKKYIRTSDELLLVQPKYDGISADFDGRILATRGDGETGENITDKLPLLELETRDYRGVLNRPARGEIIIRSDDFATLYRHIQKRGGGVYKNSRNAVAGIMGLKDITDMLKQHAKLTLVDYDLWSKQIKFSALAKVFAELIAEVEQLPYPTDGVVFKLADTAYSDSLGATAHHPRGQIAFKFSGIRRQSKLLSVEWSFGKSVLTPVANLEPVEIGGVTIKRATLHNIQNVLDMDIQVGDTVTVERAGDVIPYIVSREEGKERRSALITECPSCHTPLKRSGPELYCPNPDCLETNLQKLAAAVKNIGIEQLGEPTLRKMMLRLQVKNLADVFRLSKADLLQLDSFAEKSADNLFNEIQTARQTAPFQLLAALNIPNIGPNVAKVLLSHYDFEQLATCSADELMQVPGIGVERARALAEELHNRQAEIADLLTVINLSQAANHADDLKPTICFTGKMPEKRSFYENLARERGYSPVDNVTKNLSLLVTSESDRSSGKTAKAVKSGVRIMTLEEFLNAAPAVDDLFTPQTAPETETPHADNVHQHGAEQLTLGF